ncbi:hypothetical protein AAG570_004621 [Ranatra chinensis]|uniref:Tumor susceptibility gene 101 protein n=1 Tax=Ranatra chinensis TaxID=642074 RepID=A0ABD0Y3N4_9HEMI
MPVCIWILDTHPNNAPVCYVKPTSGMEIKTSKFVDHSGKIYLPYLHDWTPTTSDLLGLIQVMICTFGENPPMYSKPRMENTPYPPQCKSYMPMPGVSSALPYPSPYPTPSYHHTMNPTPYSPTYPPTSAASVTPYPPYPPQPQAQPMSSGTITEEHIRASLLSALQHKLSLRLEEQVAQSRAELEILQQSANELSQGKAKLDMIMERLRREKMELERNITILREKDAELEKAIAQLSEQDEIDVDEAVTTTAPLYKQILNAYAEEAATEDAIYYMGEALRRGVIDLDVFLKQVRALSRKQFMLRALMQKCRQKAGLAG